VFGSLRKIWLTWRSGKPADNQPEVMLHDPASKGPHDLDDPFFDQQVQVRIAKAISEAAQKKAD
jgi:hypothetical protein